MIADAESDRRPASAAAPRPDESSPHRACPRAPYIDVSRCLAMRHARRPLANSTRWRSRHGLLQGCSASLHACCQLACLLQPAGSACGPLAAGGIAAARVAGCAIVPNKARPTKSARKREPCMAHAHIHGIVKGQDSTSHRYPPRGSRSTASTIGRASKKRALNAGCFAPQGLAEAGRPCARWNEAGHPPAAHCPRLGQVLQGRDVAVNRGSGRPTVSATLAREAQN